MTTDPTTQHTRCVLGDSEKPHSAAPGLLVCDGHRQETYERLRAIVDTVARIAIRPAGAATGSVGRSATLASQRSVLDLESLALAGPLAPGQVTSADGWDDHHPLAVVGSWARMVREERGLDIPAGPAALTTEVNLLVRHLDWCCAQPWIDDLTTELGDTLARVHRADPERTRPGDEGRCPTVAATADGTCGGQLRRERGAVPWVLRADRCERIAVDVHAGAIRCQRCGATWATPRDEATLRVMRADHAREALRPRTEDGRAMLTADELAILHQVKRGTIAVWAHRAGVSAVRGHYDPDAVGQRGQVGA